MRYNHINPIDKAIIITLDLAVTTLSTWFIQEFASQVNSNESHNTYQKITNQNKSGFLLAIGLFSIYKMIALYLVLQFELGETHQLETVDIIGNQMTPDFATDFDDRLLDQ